MCDGVGESAKFPVLLLETPSWPPNPTADAPGFRRGRGHTSDTHHRLRGRSGSGLSLEPLAKTGLRRLVRRLSQARVSALIGPESPIPTRSLLNALTDADRLNRRRARQIRHAIKAARLRAKAILDAADDLERIADAEDSDVGVRTSSLRDHPAQCESHDGVLDSFNETS